jgi:hypothetical protein
MARSCRRINWGGAPITARLQSRKPWSPNLSLMRKTATSTVRFAIYLGADGKIVATNFGPPQPLP